MLIGQEDFLSHFEQLHGAMELNGFDVLMVYAQGTRGMYSNLLYLTGYYDFDPSLQCVLLIHADGSVRLLANSEWDLDRASRTSWIDRRAMASCADLPSELARHCHTRRLAKGRIGVVGLELLPLAFFRGLVSGLPQADLVSATSLVAERRLLKNPREIETMRGAAEITATSIRAGMACLREGISELETLAVCVRTMLENRGDELAFTPEVSFGYMTEVCAAPASANTLKQGDMVLFDLGCIFKHYVGDLSRTCVFGSPSREQRTIRDVVVGAQSAAIDAAYPGATSSEIDLAAREVVRRAGYGEYFNHGLGHGLGLDHHEPPYIDSDDLTVLKPGMVFTVEPGIYVPGVGGARIEDVIVITDAGCELVSQRADDEPWIWPNA